MIVNGHIRDMSGHTGDATGQGRDSEWTYWRWGMDISRTSYKKTKHCKSLFLNGYVLVLSC